MGLFQDAHDAISRVFGTMKRRLWTIVGIVGIVAGGWFGWRSLSGPEEAPAPEPESVVSTPDADPPAPVLAPAPENHQAYSLALGSFREAGRAERLVEGLTRRRPDLLFTIAPVRVGGLEYRRVLAGPAQDSLAAERLRASLAETLSGEDASRWIVRATPLAFDLGDNPTRESAQARVASLREAGVSAYIFSLGAADVGTFKVFAGAYSDADEAAVMRGLLDAAEAGAPDLVNRLGTPVP